MNQLKASIIAAVVGVVSVGLSFALAGLLAPKTSTTAAAVSQPVMASASLASADIISGGQNFATSCAGCHGLNGVGANGPNLHNEDMSADRIAQTIVNGKGPMPPFGGTYNAKQVNQLVEYIQTLK